MLEKLSKFEQRFREVELLLADTANSDNPKLLAELGKEYSQLESKSKTFHKYDDLLKSIESLKQIISSEDDKELVELAKEELNEELLRQTNLEEEIQVLLLPEDPNDQRNVFVEIRAAAGGDEAALFAGDIYRMYSRYSQIANWNLEIMSMNETGIGGYKEIVFSVQGENVYKKLKYESGAHRVQRVPSTESSGRIHTSTITVAVLPEADDVDVDINDNDLRIDIFHAGGHGGQNVNKVATAVRITHLPSGIVAVCQDERSQMRNKQKAMDVIKARLLDKATREQQQSISSDRKSQVGTGERAEKIRTYNFPQDRITDHRINLTIHNMENVLNGNLDILIDPIQEKEKEMLLENPVV
ncbi:MAG: peptide chain release factor 1 [Dehalococcoidia bacterium]|jgi:peptide chain release factor 1|nr:peptide chain release factor 1 [Dehalococcoidia bacterium]|tara:strand:+ start:3030 stop:4100 length:1071 start_codon:yes stop_codon:yes gene_type:complete